MADYDDALGGRMKLIASKVDSKLFFHNDAVMEYRDMKGVISDLAEERERMEQEHRRRVEAARRELLPPARAELEAASEELAAARGELAEKNKEMGEKDEEIKALRVKLKEMEAAMNSQAEQLQQIGGAPTPPDPGHAITGVQTRLTRGQVRLFQGSLVAHEHPLKARRFGQQLMSNRQVGSGGASSGDDDLELEVVRKKFIKGFMELDGGRIFGVKEMGKLNEKPFRDACAELPPEEAEKKASELYFKMVAVGGNRHEEVIDVDDYKLKELLRTWGEGPYKSVIDALVERKEYSFDSTSAYDLWNYKAGRSASLGECTEYMFDQGSPAVLKLGG
ncbi:hypothetical protein ACP4OV_022832 [Aristida adscensionis]